MDEQIAQFVSITGVDSERAKFFVESANGDVETALSTYYESEGNEGGEGGESDDEEMEGNSQTPAAATPKDEYSGPRTLSGEPAPSLPTGWGGQAATSSSAQRPGGGFSASGGRGGISTLRDLQGGGSGKHQKEVSDDEDEGEDKGPANFYTGGERSGLNVQNPNRGKKPKTPDVVQDILSKAAEKGPPTKAGPSERKAQSSAAPSFSGAGRTINDETSRQPEAALRTPQTRLPPNFLENLRNAPIGADAMRALRSAPFGGEEEDDEEDEDEDEGEVAVRNITFWQDGFSIADGPLCRYDDPQHAETLAMIKNDRAPLHLLKVRFGQRVELHVQQRTTEKYQAPPPKPMEAFSGSGNRLGAPVPAMTGDRSSSSTATVPLPPPSSSSSTSSAVGSASAPQVDASQPVTLIQIRLGDGQKLVAKFNQTHTVADVRQYINTARPDAIERQYTLQSSFPPKPLTDESQSLKDAGLINSVVIQKWA
ncbi:hypothetical protein CBS101457_005269 [Exobasidium rhododendri]|nr:hypothetical protein CBS101457_005269 [Exobasidium rhododendri]